MEDRSQDCTVWSGLGTDQRREVRAAGLWREPSVPCEVRLLSRVGVVHSGPPGLCVSEAHSSAPQFSFLCLLLAPGPQGCKSSLEQEDTFIQHFHMPAPLCLEGSKSLALSIFTLAKAYSSFKSSSDVTSSVKPSLTSCPDII